MSSELEGMAGSWGNDHESRNGIIFPQRYFEYAPVTSLTVRERKERP